MRRPCASWSAAVPHAIPRLVGDRAPGTAICRRGRPSESACGGDRTPSPRTSSTCRNAPAPALDQARQATDRRDAGALGGRDRDPVARHPRQIGDRAGRMGDLGGGAGCRCAPCGDAQAGATPMSTLPDELRSHRSAPRQTAAPGERRVVEPPLGLMRVEPRASAARAPIACGATAAGGRDSHVRHASVARDRFGVASSNTRSMNESRKINVPRRSR